MEGEEENSNPRFDDNSQQTADDPDRQTDDPDSFGNKPAWMRLIILCAGPIMNIILGFLLTLIIVLTNQVNGRITLLTNTVYSFADESASISSETGLKKDDTVIKVGNVPVHIWQELAYEIGIQGSKKEEYTQKTADGTDITRSVVFVDMTVIRNGETVELKKIGFAAREDNGIVVGDVDIIPYAEVPSVINVIKHAWYWSWSSVKMVWDSLLGLITGRFSLGAVSGIVGTTKIVSDAATEAAKSGTLLNTFLYLFSVISINLGVFNLLPFLPLDGGHILFAVYELIFRRRAPKRVINICQTVGIILMFGLMIIITVKDVIGLF